MAPGYFTVVDPDATSTGFGLPATCAPFGTPRVRTQSRLASGDRARGCSVSTGLNAYPPYRFTATYFVSRYSLIPS
jgi:hypothetical protein